MAKSKAFAVAAFGVLACSQGSMRQSDVVVHMKDGEMAYFTTELGEDPGGVHTDRARRDAEGGPSLTEEPQRFGLAKG